MKIVQLLGHRKPLGNRLGLAAVTCLRGEDSNRQGPFRMRARAGHGTEAHDEVDSRAASYQAAEKAEAAAREAKEQAEEEVPRAPSKM